MPKVMVVIPEGLLSEVDGAAAASQTNRSAFICRSLRAQLRSDRLRHLRRKILDDAKIIAGTFRSTGTLKTTPCGWLRRMKR
jgi:metal-responsive CopG/Arc/MetJ family transcriptional regulator